MEKSVKELFAELLGNLYVLAPAMHLSLEKQAKDAETIKKAMALLEEVASALRLQGEGQDAYFQELADKLVGKQNAD